MKDSDPFKVLIKTVVENDFCIGCGACAAIENSPIKIQLNSQGQYQAFIDKEYTTANTYVNEVCPFGKDSLDEDEIAKDIFDKDINYEHKIGYFDELYAGYVIEGSFRENGSSGGFGSWIAAEMMKNGLIDEVIHVKGGTDNLKFQYSISQNEEEILEGSKSRYYPVEMSQVLEYIKATNKKIAIVGIPCFIKSVRLLARKNPEVNRNIKFTIGLVCGHLKSSLYSQMLAWEMGVNPGAEFDIDFRKKKKGKKASDYSTEIISKSDAYKEVKEKQTNEMFGTTWGYGFFKYNACDYCDDILAETADVTVGDAWIPEYSTDYMGTNIIVSRSKVISNLLNQAFQKERIKLDKLSANKIIESQAGGFRHRHTGLSYRLYIKDKKKEWRPKKRIEPSNELSIKKKLLYRLRILIRRKSISNFMIAKKYNSLSLFKILMLVYVLGHEMLSKITMKNIKRKLGYIVR